MNYQQIVAILEAYGISLAVQGLTAPLAAIIIKNPAVTDAQLVSTEDGSLKHLMRTKIGFFVDIFWADVEPTVDSAITAAIPQARAIAGVADPSSAS